MPPDEIDAIDPYTPGRLGVPRVTYTVEDLGEFVTSVVEFSPRQGRNMYLGLIEEEQEELARILFLYNVPEYKAHLDHIFNFGELYGGWLNLWADERDLMNRIRELIYNEMRDMTVEYASSIQNNLLRSIDRSGIIASRSPIINFVLGWVYTLARVYESGAVAFPRTLEISNTVTVEGNLWSSSFHFMRVLVERSGYYSRAVFDTLDDRFSWLQRSCFALASAIRNSSYIFTAEDISYIRSELSRTLDLNRDALFNLMRNETNLGSPTDIRELAEGIHRRLWSPLEDAFIFNATRSINHTPLVMNMTVPPNPENSLLTTLNTRRAFYNLTRSLNVPVPENLSDSQIEIFMRNYTAPIVSEEIVTVPYDYDIHVDPIEGEDAVNVTVRDTSFWADFADAQNMRHLADAIDRTETMLPLSAVGFTEDTTAYPLSAVGFTGDTTAYPMTGCDNGFLTQENSEAFLSRIEDEEAALNSQGVNNLNDIANSHVYNSKSVFEERRKKFLSEQEVWENLQKNHAGMMETIQYILDDCTIDYKVTDKNKRIDKMKNEMVPRIKGVLCSMDDRLDHYEKFYIEKWLSELIQFAINCNGFVSRRVLSPDIKNWDQKEEPRIKKIHTSLHIIPRLSE